MLKTIVLFAILMTCCLAAPAQAQIYYPWCAVYGGRANGGTNCGFSTLAQCRATVSGIGGFCEQNPFYNDRERPPARRAHRLRDD